MFHPFYSQQIIFLSQPFYWVGFLGFGVGILNVLAVVFIGFFARRIAQKQAEISERQTNLEDYADIFIRPYKFSNTEKWELQIRSACPRAVFILDGWFEEDENKKAFGNLRFSRREPATLPAGEHNYYSLPIPDLGLIAKSEGVPTFHFHIKFKDVLSKERESHHAGWFQEDRWVIHNLKSN